MGFPQEFPFIAMIQKKDGPQTYCCNVSDSTWLEEKSCIYCISLNTAQVLNWTRVNLSNQIEKFKSFKVSISTLSRFEPEWLWTMNWN